MSWDELVAAALLGTARRPPALAAAPAGTALGQVLAGLDPSDAEGWLLSAGAVVGLYRQAGVCLPVDTSPLPVAGPAETRPYCSEAAADRLGAILAGGFRLVLPQWLDLAARAERVVPPARLPALLDAASFTPTLRPPTVAVIGERGRWLAAQNQVWAWAGGGDESGDTWATGSAASRRLHLARLRAADPRQARTLLESTWASETPEDRAAGVAALATGLSMDDEPFLEAALDDRRKEVRQAAAWLLWRLPDSRLGQRMAERSRPLVRAGTLPELVDPAMVRDGVVAKPPAGLGARAWWLYQLVAATPLATWGAPEDMLEAADPLLRRAWAAAAAAQHDEAWAVALLGAGDGDEPGLLGAVPHERAVAVAADRVARHGLTPAVLDLLDHCPLPWGPELSAIVVDRLVEVVRRQGRPAAEAVALRARLADLALRLDPSAAAWATTAVAAAAPWWTDVVSWFLDLLTFRADMREELSW